MTEISSTLCEEKHRRVDETLALHNRCLDDHDGRLDAIEQVSVRLEERLDNLIIQLGQLNTSMKWFMGLMVGGFTGFFFYVVQNGLFK